MINVAMIGAGGRMGRMIIAAIDADPELTLCGAVERPDHPFIGRPVHEVAGCGPREVAFSATLPKRCGVAIDFSSAESIGDTVRQCVENSCALMVGTTGFGEPQMALLKEASASIAVLRASNTSLGVNLLLKIARDVSAALGTDYDIEIVEAHHRNKKDAPSGTALSLAEAVSDGRGQVLAEAACYGRHGMVGERPAGEIGIHAVRGGDIVGEHRLLFAGAGESIEIVHRAHSREVFAQGAVRAAKFLSGRAPGWYTMADVLFS